MELFVNIYLYQEFILCLVCVRIRCFGGLAKFAGLEYAGLENDRLENDGRSRRGGMT